MSLNEGKSLAEIDGAFPFPTYRSLYGSKSQRHVIKAICDAFESGFKTVILGSPTGTGKSSFLTTLCNLSDSAFYTTPQKSLRYQLQEDKALQNSYNTLRAREDYICQESGTDCKRCPVNFSSYNSCMEMDGCSYWNAKSRAMDGQTAVLTFAYLIIDSQMPQDNNGTTISFGDRELLCIDEAHGLEDQVASLHAGIEISPNTLPRKVYNGVASKIPYDGYLADEVTDILETVQLDCKRFIENVSPSENNPEQNINLDKCKNMISKLEWFWQDMEDENPWVVDINDFGRSRDRMVKVRPVDVGGFMRRNVWRRSERRILSTATIPFRTMPDWWCYRLGLDPTQAVKIEVGMPFHKKKRKVHTATQIASMSNGGIDRNWDSVVSTLDDLAERHDGQRGLIHSISYNRARRLMSSIGDETPYLKDNVIQHRRNADNSEMLNVWQSSDKDILVSPSMMEGVDLYDDKCRFQAMLKNPNPNTNDSRWKYLLDERKDWESYFTQSMNSVIQSVGRGVRHKNDWCEFYVLDKDFDSLISRTSPPQWFTKSIVD